MVDSLWYEQQIVIYIDKLKAWQDDTINNHVKQFFEDKISTYTIELRNARLREIDESIKDEESRTKNKEPNTALFLVYKLIEITDKEIVALKIGAEDAQKNSDNLYSLIHNEFPKFHKELDVLNSFKEELVKRLGNDKE